MSCEISLGRLEPCKDSIGGISSVYFFNYGVDVTVDTDGTITDIQDGGGAATCYKWELKGASSLEETINSSRDMGTTFFSQALNLTFKKIDAETNNEIKLLAWGRPQIVVADKNGNARMVGTEQGAEVTGGTIVTGTAMGDLYGYTLNFTGEEKLPANLLVGATLANPFAGLTTAPTVVVGT